MAPKKSVQPPRNRQVAKFSLSPIMKPAEDLLREKHRNPSSVDLRTLGVSSLSHATAVAIVEDKGSPYTICGWPKGHRTNERYAALLSLKDEFDMYFFLSRTSPELCVTDANQFLYRCLDHFLRRIMSKEIAEGKAALSDFLGQPPAPFEKAYEVEYIAYLKWIRSSACLDKHNHEMILYRAECLLVQLLARKGFKLREGVSASEWLRRDAEQYDEVDRLQRNVAAHLFTSLLKMERDDIFTAYDSDFPSPQREVLNDMSALGKKVLILEHLKSKRPKFGDSSNSTSIEAALFLIETFLGSTVRRCQEVSYGESRVMIPGLLPANSSVLKL